MRTENPIFARHVKKDGKEIIAKNGESVYARGRSADWLKFKCLNEQEFVIGGYTDPKGSRTGFGALLVGFYEAGKIAVRGQGGARDTTRTHSKACTPN